MARSITDMARLDLPIEQVLEASLPDMATDPSIVQPDPAWLRGRQTFMRGDQVDSGEFQIDLVLSTNGLIR